MSWTSMSGQFSTWRSLILRIWSPMLRMPERSFSVLLSTNPDTNFPTKMQDTEAGVYSMVCAKYSALLPLQSFTDRRCSGATGVSYLASILHVIKIAGYNLLVVLCQLHSLVPIRIQVSRSVSYLSSKYPVITFSWPRISRSSVNSLLSKLPVDFSSVSYTHLRAHETA